MFPATSLEAASRVKRANRKIRKVTLVRAGDIGLYGKRIRAYPARGAVILHACSNRNGTAAR